MMLPEKPMINERRDYEGPEKDKLILLVRRLGLEGQCLFVERCIERIFAVLVAASRAMGEWRVDALQFARSLPLEMRDEGEQNGIRAAALATSRSVSRDIEQLAVSYAARGRSAQTAAEREEFEHLAWHAKQASCVARAISLLCDLREHVLAILRDRPYRDDQFTGSRLIYATDTVIDLLHAAFRAASPHEYALCQEMMRDVETIEAFYEERRGGHTPYRWPLDFGPLWAHGPPPGWIQLGDRSRTSVLPDRLPPSVSPERGRSGASGPALAFAGLSLVGTLIAIVWGFYLVAGVCAFATYLFLVVWVVTRSSTPKLDPSVRP
jgi:hypothetical protein